MEGLIPDRDYRIPSSCGIVGIMQQKGRGFSGRDIIQAIALMRERCNGLGGGFAAYGIYPEYKDYYAFHLMYEENKARELAESYLKENFEIVKDEPIPTYDVNPVRERSSLTPLAFSNGVKTIKHRPILWRYFLKTRISADNRNPRISADKNQRKSTYNEEDFVIDTVMFINRDIKGAFVASSGKNMGIFKGVGYPEDIGKFFRLEEYQGYLWTAHGRFPTNTVAWWGGAHPFGLLDCSVVHNGEISSYGINRRYLRNFGYECSFFTDTEVITYLFDLFRRKHNLDFEIIAKVLASPFWDEIERMPQKEKEFFTNLRIIYASALVNGPFAVIVANTTTMVGLNDRIKLRPLVAATKDDFVYIASEESAIREICPQPDKVWLPKAGEPVIARLAYG